MHHNGLESYLDNMNVYFQFQKQVLDKDISHLKAGTVIRYCLSIGASGPYQCDKNENSDQTTTAYCCEDTLCNGVRKSTCATAVILSIIIGVVHLCFVWCRAIIGTLREESSQTNVILQYKLLASILSAVCSVIQQS